MDQPTQPTPRDRARRDIPPLPEPEPVGRDPLAVAIGNASGLSIGYLLLGRRRTALITMLVTVALVALLATFLRTQWFETVLVLWWLGLVGHGWYLATDGRWLAMRKQQLVAVAVAVPVLTLVGLLRVDAAGIDRAVDTARVAGDCAQVRGGQQQMWFAHYLVDAPMTARVDGTVTACERVEAAQGRLDAVAAGDATALQATFDDLRAALTSAPGSDAMVNRTLQGLLDRLPTGDPCHTAAIGDWIHRMAPTDTVLDRMPAEVAELTPPALLDCADRTLAAGDGATARAHYQNVIDNYPGNAQTPRATDGVGKATVAAELATVRSLLQAGPDGAQPAYCAQPAAHSGAAPYAPGVNKAVFAGYLDAANRLPVEWKAADPAEAVLVVCIGPPEQGAVTRTCEYRSAKVPDQINNVTFHKVAMPVKAYELRTGNVVADIRMEIDGQSCPPSVPNAPGTETPLPDTYVLPTDADVLGAFTPLITKSS